MHPFSIPMKTSENFALGMNGLKQVFTENLRSKINTELKTHNVNCKGISFVKSAPVTNV